MNRENTNEEIKNRLKEYLQEIGIDVNRKFRCLNPNHVDEHPSMSYDKNRKKVHCFSCMADYDTFDVMEIKTGLHGKELFEYGYKYFGLKEEKISQSLFPLEVKMVEENEMERKKYIEKCKNDFEGSAGEKYLNERGITTETAKLNKVGYDEKIRSLVLEYHRKNYYITRSIENKEYRKPIGEKEPLYETGDNSEKLAYITESGSNRRKWNV